jgi:hypothetical protein
MRYRTHCENVVSFARQCASAALFSSAGSARPRVIRFFFGGDFVFTAQQLPTVATIVNAFHKIPETFSYAFGTV